MEGIKNGLIYTKGDTVILYATDKRERYENLIFPPYLKKEADTLIKQFKDTKTITIQEGGEEVTLNVTALIVCEVKENYIVL